MRTIQCLLGHDDLRTTMLYTHVLQRGPFGVRSPLDAIDLARAVPPMGTASLEADEIGELRENYEEGEEEPLSE